MIKRLTIFILLFFSLAAAADASRQSGRYDDLDGLLVDSADPAGDSAAFREIRRKMSEIRKERPTVGLVLSGGGAKGASLAGAIRYIEERRVPIDLVVGTSIGGLVGGLYALGYSPDAIDSLFVNADWEDMLGDDIPVRYLPLFRKKITSTYMLRLPFHYRNGERRSFTKSIPDGCFNGLNTYNLFSSKAVGYEDSLNFWNLPIPFATVSTDMVSMDEVNLTKGDLVEALRSTMSIPLVFRPIRTRGMILMDGGTRNNFPVDLARELGADYVIGVDLDQVLSYDQLNNMVDYVLQAFNAMSTESYKINWKQADICIRPDMTGFNSMSFDPEKIAVIREKGYAEAQCHSESFDILLELIGGEQEKRLAAKPATDIGRTRVSVDSLTFSGMNERAAKFFRKRCGIVPGQSYAKANLDAAVATIYGTGAFESVSYRLYGKEEPYTLDFKCAERQIHQLSVGIRGDTETALGAICNLGLWSNKLWGPELDFTVRLSISPYFKAAFTCSIPSGPGFGVEYAASLTNYKGTDADGKYFKEFYHNEFRAFIGTGRYGLLDLKGGIKLMNNPYCLTVSEGATTTVRDWKNNYLTAFAKMEIDTRDEVCFPSRGVRLTADYDYLLGKESPAHYIAASFQAAIPAGERFTILPSVSARIIKGEENANFYMNNYVGGRMAGRYYDSQLALPGWYTVMNCGNSIAVANLSLRYRFGKNLFAYTFASGLLDKQLPEEQKGRVLTFGLELGYKIPVGPIILDAAWCSYTRSMNFYLGVGFDF